jgi:hypothetical protein
VVGGEGGGSVREGGEELDPRDVAGVGRKLEDVGEDQPVGVGEGLGAEPQPPERPVLGAATSGADREETSDGARTRTPRRPYRRIIMAA